MNPKPTKSLWEDSPQIPPSTVVGHCKQTEEFTLPDSLKYLTKATGCQRMNLASAAEIHLKCSEYILYGLPDGLQKNERKTR